MAPTHREDDPTHALDDFVQRMRQAASTAAAPPTLDDLSALTTRLHQGPANAGPRGGVLRSGQRWIRQCL